MAILWANPASLDVLVKKDVGLVLEMVIGDGSSEAGPMFGELFVRNSIPALSGLGIRGHGAEQVKNALRFHRSEEFLAVMLFVRQDQGFVGGFGASVQNFGGHIQQSGRSLGHRLGSRSKAKAQGLTGVAIQQEKGLHHFDRLLLHIETMPPHLALGVADDAVGIQSQKRAVEVLAGAAQFTEGDLQLLRLGQPYEPPAIHGRPDRWEQRAGRWPVPSLFAKGCARSAWNINTWLLR